MAEKPTISSKLPTKTLVFYILFGVIGCALISIAHYINIDFSNISSTKSLLDLLTTVMFALFSILCIIRCTKRLDVYNDRIERKSIIGSRITFFKEMNGHFVDGSLNNTLGTARGYFRGIILKKKDGSHFSLNKAELTHFDKITKHFRSRCRYFNNKAIRKLTKKEDRKLYFFLIIVLVILIASLLH